MNLRLPYYIIISLILVVGLVGNLFVWENRLIGLTFGPAYLAFCALMLGFVLFKYRPTIFKILYGALFLLAGISFFGALIYYFYKLSDFAIAALIILIPLLILPFLKYGNHPEAKQDFNPVQVNPHLLRTTLLVALFIFLEIINLRSLLGAGTVEAIRTPWKILPFNFFLNYFAASLILLWFILKSQKEGLNLVLTSVHTFLTVSLVLFIYKIGYGFDPFIHQATEKVIASQGFILPKPFYYLGQYSLVVFLSKISFLLVERIDKLLLPLLFSLTLPTTIYFSLKPFTGKNQTPGASLLSLLVLILPFTTFIATTPQGLANFILLIIIFLGLLVLRREFPIFYLWFLAFVALLIHPLAGLPALIFVFFLTLFRFLKKQEGIFEFIHHLVFLAAFAFGAVAISLLFLFVILFFRGPATIFSLGTIENSKNILETLGWHWPIWVNHFRPLYDLIYTYGKNIPFILLAVGLAGYGLLKKQLPSSIIYVMAFLAMIINYILMKLFIDFPALIKYEQGIFPQRILEISFYFLIPLFLFALYKFFEKLETAGGQTIKFFFIVFFAMLLTFSLYYSYPKDDGEDYQIDRGYSVSATDISAVHAIDQDAADVDYIVLANQSVSAAAVREFGFAKYYGPHFYYPIPTGDPLYQYYLKMVYGAPSRATVTEAANLTGVNLVYFVLNNYWTDADKIVEAAKPTANNIIEIDGGKIWIFKYQF
jgi:hypothetical protein